MVSSNEQDEALQRLVDAQTKQPSEEALQTPPRTPTRPSRDAADELSSSDKGGESGEDDEDEDEDEDDDEEEEPLLKYTTLTKNQGGLYRNGDAVSTFMVAGDKMIVGTHNGFVHVFALPSFQPIKVYHAHQASITALSISPYPPPLPSAGGSKPKTGQDASSNDAPASPKAKPTAGKPGAKASPQPKSQVVNTPSNQIHIASSSIDGFVFVQSLVEGRDVVRRNFRRPVHAVSLSPDYKNDRTYLSGGTAGLLVKTVGGTIGKTSDSTTIGGASATAQSWLGSVGLASDEGKDTVLHQGEGKINTVKWSLSGKYVVWVNEQGIKVMRSHLHFEGTSDAEIAWKRMSHIDRPKLKGWDEMAAAWKARAEWVDEDGLERDSEIGPAAFANGKVEEPPSDPELKKRIAKNRVERLLIGWGGSIWVMDVHPGQSDSRASNSARLGRVDVITILRTDCIISGLSLYTPSLLLVLAYIQPDDTEDAPQVTASPGTPSGGRKRRNNAQRPEMRIIDIRTKEEVSIADTISVDRFDTLTSGDYHLSTLPVIRESTKVTSSKGALEMMGSLGSNIYGGIWDVAMYPKSLLSSGASIMSNDYDGDKLINKHNSILAPKKLPEASVNPSLLTRGIKVFVHSPFDCVLATKPTITDHLHWITAHHEYEAAWKLLDERPEAAGTTAAESDSTSTPATPTKGAASLRDFFADDSSVSTTHVGQGFHSQATKEKRIIGDKWIMQLVQANEWKRAGQVAGQVLDTVKGWDIWYWRFAKEGKFNEIAPYIPADRLPHQPLLSATIYEHAMAHFISHDPPRFAELLETWSTDLFDPTTIIQGIESRLKTGEFREDSVEDGQKGRYWRILYDGLAKLYLAAGRYRDALRAYVKLQDADTALALIKTQHLAHAVADDIPSLILLRVSRDQLGKASTEELDEAAADIIQLLVAEAYQGIIPTSTVISQLKPRKELHPFLYLYLRKLWTGQDSNTAEALAPVPDVGDPTTNILSGNVSSSPQATKFAPSAARSVARELDESRALVNDAADVALPLFATYSRPLFASFLRVSNSYTLSKASAICEEHDYVPELVFLLAKEGRARRALHLILDRLGDVAQAMAFAREQGDSDLWDDLVEYSLNRPEFVKVLLEEAGSAGGSAGGLEGSGLDPVGLIRKIPDGMEIEGLKEALGRMLREFELRASISEGVLRVCRGEVAHSMTGLRGGQKRGIKFDVQSFDPRPGSSGSAKSAKGHNAPVAVASIPPRRRRKKRRRAPDAIPPGHCAACGEMLLEDEPKTLISFPCSHVFHLPCLILYESMPPAQEEEKKGEGEQKTGANAREAGREDVDEDDEESDPEAELGLPEPEGDVVAAPEGGWGVGSKVKYAKIIRGRVAGGCPLTVHVVA